MLDATPLLRMYAQRRLASLAHQNPLEAQRKQLRWLLRHAAFTQFGKDHEFTKIRSVEDYQKQVKLRRYEDFWRDYWQKPFPRLTGTTWPDAIKFIAASSGTTTGKTKFIPVSQQMIASNRRAILDMLAFHLARRPGSRVLSGRTFMLGGSTDLNRPAAGVYTGDLSGIAAKNLPWWAKPRYFPPPTLAKIADWTEKVAALAPLSLSANLTLMGGTVSWLLSFLEQAMAAKAGATSIADISPQLDLLIHGGVSFEPYRRRFSDLLAGSRAETSEVYPASEGFIAIQDRGSGEGLRLLADNGLFYEFVPVEELDSAQPTRHWLGTVETGRNYAIALTTNAGLWSYLLGDTVRFVDTAPARIVVTGRLSHSLSAFGEHLIGEEIEAAVTGAAAHLGVHVTDFTVAPEFPAAAGDKGRHVYIIELSNAAEPEQAKLCSELIDQDLMDRNLDYREHRHGDVQMAAPEVGGAPPGTFAHWMNSRGKLGAQNKVPRVMSENAMFKSLIEMI